MLHNRLKNILLGVTFGWHAMFSVGLVAEQASVNQTATYSPILPATSLPFELVIEEADFKLPQGLNSSVCAVYKDKWLLLAGRTNGLHGFNNDPNNFPPSMQNSTVYVIDPERRIIGSRSLADPHSGLTQHQIDLLSVTAPQAYQEGSTLYMTGGYGVDTASGQFSTKAKLFAIDVPGLMSWVLRETKKDAASFIRSISHPLFQVTGGEMVRVAGHSTLLVFGQNFQGFYFDTTTNGTYTNQVRRFDICDNGCKLSIKAKKSRPEQGNSSYRRRDYNLIATIRPHKDGRLEHGFVALSGVFTPQVGAWTVPVEITADGTSSMADPAAPATFKQGMNNYNCAHMELFSEKSGNMYSTLFGGLSVGFFQDGKFTTDPEIPFINQVTTIQIDPAKRYKQFIMDAEFPVILSTQSNVGNPLLFGTEALFIPAKGIPLYDNGVIKWDEVASNCCIADDNGSILVGYIVGGIQSTLPNTNAASDSAASPYIFNVFLIPKHGKKNHHQHKNC